MERGNFSCSENTSKPFSLYNLPFSDPQTGKTGKHETKQKTVVVLSEMAIAIR